MPKPVLKVATVDIPDEYASILNSVLLQIKMVVHSGKNHNLAAIHILQSTKEFFKNNPNIKPIKL